MRHERTKLTAFYVWLFLSLCLVFGFWFSDTANAKRFSGGITVVEKNLSKKVKLKNGKAIAPTNAPVRIKRIIRAANRISHTPYKWGGGHGAWKDSGYDCSGSLSYALRGGNLLSSPLTSGGLAGWGKAGKGNWLTVYANSGHTFMIFKGGVKFDTSGANPSRWQSAKGSTRSGYSIRRAKNL